MSAFILAHLEDALKACTILPRHGAAAVHGIIAPASFIALTAGPRESPLAVFLVILERAFVETTVGLLDLCIALKLTV